MSRFDHFAAIDWSGARGERHKGIAVALCSARLSAPSLVKPGHIWSRQDILDWLMREMPANTLVGLDIGMSLPFVDVGAYFPGWASSPSNAHALWSLIDAMCAGDAHLAASSFVDHAEAARHFRRHGGRKGDLFEGRGRLRETERGQLAQRLNPYSNLNLVGAAQVGKSSLTGMRVLHRLAARIPVWPFDRDPGRGSMLVEIYTSIAARDGGRPRGRSKMRTVEALNDALTTIGSKPTAGSGPIDDHKSDALLTAAWLRASVAVPELWHPAAMTEEIALTEGWTFGVR